MLDEHPAKSFSPFEHLLIALQSGLETVFGEVHAVRERPMSADDTVLSADEAQYSARLMRINHSGEVCAQALYRGAALMADNEKVYQAMQHAAVEEQDHLAWCQSRIHELNSHTSYFNPLWYAGSFVLGAVAGAIGDKWSLGFVEETEQQVTQHLQTHLSKISPNDKASLAILNQMQIDEAAHAEMANAAGANPLPAVVKHMMTYASKIMTHSVYWV